MLQVEAEATSAPPPMMATFVQPAQPVGGGVPGGGNPMGAPMGGAPMGGAPAGGGMPMGMPGGMGIGTPVGGNMFARQARTGARSRYVDTLNPNVNDAAPVFYLCFECAFADTFAV